MALYTSRSVEKHTQGSVTEFDILKESHKFLRDDTGAEASTSSWNDQLAKKYYDSLYREFALCNLKHYKSGNFSLRWRTENEVLDGTGEMTCANMRCEYHRPHSAPTPPSLTTLELPFAYEEKGVAKQALVKVVLCPKCVRKLMWKRTRKRLTEKGKAVVDGGDESRERESVEDPENHGQEGDSRDARRRHRVISPESRSVSPRPHKRHRGRSELSNKRVFDSHDNRKRHQKVHTEHGVVEGVEES